ncbi:hypothetical protein [Lactococcus cremoris]|nr:hypothetical protein [Lactococcus cremoris]
MAPIYGVSPSLPAAPVAPVAEVAAWVAVDAPVADCFRWRSG